MDKTLPQTRTHAKTMYGQLRIFLIGVMMISDAVFGAIVGGALTALGSFMIYYVSELRNRRNQLRALLVEIQHNINVSQRELEGNLPWELRHTYHTLSYTSAKDAGAISSLQRELREKVLDTYDIIFALHRDEMGCAAATRQRSDYVKDLHNRLEELSRLLEKHTDP